MLTSWYRLALQRGLATRTLVRARPIAVSSFKQSSSFFLWKLGKTDQTEDVTESLSSEGLLSQSAQAISTN